MDRVERAVRLSGHAARWRGDAGCHACRAAAWLGVLVLSANVAIATNSPHSSAVPASPLDGLPVISIRFVRRNVFDTSNPKTSAWLYRAANRIHIVTRESYLRARLLFKVGDPYSQDKVEESARILRNLGWLNPVNITAHRKGNGVEVIVETHDLWSLQAGVEFGMFGNRTRSGVTVWDENFLGLGKQISVGHTSTFERNEWTFFYLDPDLLGTRKQLWLEHQDTTEGLHDEGWLKLPFYSLDSSRAWGVSFVRQHMDEYLWSSASKVVRGLHAINWIRVWGGVRLGSRTNGANRIIFGWDHQIDDFDNWRWIHRPGQFTDPANRHIEGPRIGFEHLADNYEVVYGFRAWTSQEDIALGPNYSIHTTCSLPGLGDGRRREPFDARFHRGWRRGRWLFINDLWTSGRWESPGAENWRTGGQIIVAEIGTQGWQGRLMIENVANADGELQLPLGSFTGLRGWDPFAFNGTGRALFNLQWRKLMREDVLGLFSLGMETFVDVGDAWGGRVDRGTGGVRADFGVGLLADLTHVGLAHLIRLELAFPDDGSGFVITGTTHFLF